MIRLLEFLQQLIQFYQIILIVAVVMSWLFASGRVNRFDPRLRGFMQALNGVTEPLFRRVRPWLPNTGALDLTPMAVWFLCIFLDRVVIGDIIQFIQTGSLW